MGENCLSSVRGLNNSKQHQIARSLYYSSVPALTVDRSGCITDYNLALETLFGDVLSGRRYSQLTQLLNLLELQVRTGCLIPVDSNWGTKAECSFDSQNIGPVDLICSAVTFNDTFTSDDLGKVIFWDVRVPDGDDRFHDHYRRKLDHQLIWDTYAWSYDRILPLMPYYQDVLERHVDALTASCDGPIIDLGAGTGNLVERLVVAGRSVTAVDGSRAMLEKLRSKRRLMSALGIQLTVFEAGAESLPMIEDQSQAGVSFQLALFDMHKPELALRTALRVLRPGGSIVVTDLKRSFSLDPLLEECERHLRHLGLFDDLSDDLRRVIRSNHDLAPGSQSSLRIEDVFDFLSMHNFQGLSIKESHLGQCATVIGQKPQSAFSS